MTLHTTYQKMLEYQVGFRFEKDLKKHIELFAFLPGSLYNLLTFEWVNNRI